MKRYLLLGLASLVVAGGLVTVTPTPADAFVCYARSSWGYNGWARGWGRSVSHARARAIALANCAARTPRGATCSITGCRWR
jgi:hypothetical protein